MGENEVTIEYDDGTRAWWLVTEEQIEAIEKILGSPSGMRC